MTGDGAGVANETGLVGQGRQVDQATPRRHRKVRRRRLKWALAIFGVMILLVVAAIAGYGWYLGRQIHRVPVGGLAKPADGAEQNTENILMVGSTDRCTLTVQNPAYGLCSQGVNGINSDVVMILHLNPSAHSLSILSIPRDLFIPNARSTGANKIDAALEEGPTQLVKAIEEDFGIPIQHFVELNFDTFANVVNALGGIKMYFPEPVYDQYSGLDIPSPGCIALNGTEALEVVRARHVQYKGPGVTSTNPADWPQEGQSDLARIERDHEFLRVLATAVSKKGLGNPITDAEIVNAVAPQLEVDSGFSTSNMISLVLTYHGVNPNKAPQWTLPVMVDQFGDYIYEGGDYGDIEFPDQPNDQQVVDGLLGVRANTNTMTGHPLPPPSSVTVSVVNGTGTYDQAADVAGALQALGFNVAGTGDQDPVGSEAETVVYYSSRSASAMAAAQEVARSLSGAVIMAYDPSEVAGGAQVTVVTGTDFSVSSPGASTSHAASSTSSATPTSTTTTAPSGEFSAPTQAVEPLSPWDPRSCTASGGEGP